LTGGEDINDITEPVTEIISGTINLNTTEPAVETSTETEIDTPEENTVFTEEETTYIITETNSDTTEEKLYVVTKSGTKYHYATCYHARNPYKYLTKEEAEKLGYEPCSVCKPE